MKIGMTGYGNPETTTGGNALKFYSSIRLDIRKIQSLKDKEEIYGNRVKVKVVKNKVAPPFREAQFDILYGTGVSKEGELLDLGVQYGLVDKSGSWYAYGSERLGQGKENVRAFLQENSEIKQSVEDDVLRHLGLKEPKEEITDNQRVQKEETAKESGKE